MNFALSLLTLLLEWSGYGVRLRESTARLSKATDALDKAIRVYSQPR